MNYVYAIDASPYLAHHGIRGQRWGVRRFQDISGSLTEAGRKRYNRAKKVARFGVALAKAKGEHYGKQAESYAKDVNVLSRNLAAKAVRLYDPHYYKNKSNTAVWDYYAKRKANENQVLAAQRQVKRMQQIGRDYLEQYQEAQLTSAGAQAEMDSKYRRYNRSLNDYSFVASAGKSISEYGRNYLEAEAKKAELDNLKWQDYFTPADPISYSISRESRESLRNLRRDYGPEFRYGY